MELAPMLRLVSYLLLMVFLITIVRGVIGILAKAFGEALRATNGRTAAPAAGQPPIAVAGELKKDPVCGTYTAAQAGLERTVGGQTFYFCSPECRDKFMARAS